MCNCSLFVLVLIILQLQMFNQRELWDITLFLGK